jgi:hypothetical protein
VKGYVNMQVEEWGTSHDPVITCEYQCIFQNWPSFTQLKLFSHSLKSTKVNFIFHASQQNHWITEALLSIV